MVHNRWAFAVWGHQAANIIWECQRNKMVASDIIFDGKNDDDAHCFRGEKQWYTNMFSLLHADWTHQKLRLLHPKSTRTQFYFVFLREKLAKKTEICTSTMQLLLRVKHYKSPIGHFHKKKLPIYSSRLVKPKLKIELCICRFNLTSVNF